jgi:hypothetical protein
MFRVVITTESLQPMADTALNITQTAFAQGRTMTQQEDDLVAVFRGILEKVDVDRLFPQFFSVDDDDLPSYIREALTPWIA